MTLTLILHLHPFCLRILILLIALCSLIAKADRCIDLLGDVIVSPRGLFFGPPNQKTEPHFVPLDEEIGPNTQVIVCVGKSIINEPLLADIKTFISRGARVIRPDDWNDLFKAIETTPDSIDHIYFDAHGSPEGRTIMPGIADFYSNSRIFERLYGQIRKLNKARSERDVSPVKLTLLQCHGAVCATTANFYANAVTRGSETRTSIPRSTKHRSMGGGVKTYIPPLILYDEPTTQ